MSDQPAPPASSKALKWVGYVLSYLPAAALVFGGVMAIVGGEQSQKGLAEMGYAPDSGRPIGVALLISAILYIAPQTTVLGAILLTGYLGGAVATHVRVQDGNFYFAVIFGILLWLGLLLREPRLRPLLPLRKS